MKLTVRGATDVGLKRSHNEDSHGCWVPESPAELDRRGALMVIADGMGGSRAGEVASRLAVEAVLRAYRESSLPDPLAALRAALESANQVVHGESTTRAGLDGMGTTCTAVVIQDDRLFLAHVGDSRAYLVRDGRIQQLTDDHSLVAQLIREHQLTAEQARSDPRRNVVTRSVGIGATVDVDAQVSPVTLVEGDTILLCTDGLHGLVRDEELVELAAGPSLERACHELIGRAKQRGGHDNITVVLGRLEPSHPLEPPESLPAERAGTSRRTLALLAIALFGLLLALAAIGWLMFRLGREPQRLGGGATPLVRMRENQA
jgi:protein phosphatase